MDKVIELINNAKKCAIIPHIKADGDAIGSCLAMRTMLRKMGKAAVIYIEEPIEKRLEFLNDDIAVIYDGEPVDCDTCIVLDCGDMGRVSKREPIFSSALHTVNIDHHRTNTFFAEANYVEADACATGEILFKLFRKMGHKLDAEISGYLYAAICSDSGCFAYSNVSPDTFRIAAELIEYDINHAEIARLLFDCEDINSERMKAELTGKINSYCDGRLRVVTVSENDTAKYGIKPEDIQDLVNLPRRIRGTEIAAALKQYDGKIRVSLRSNGDADVAAVAMVFGGGGHTKAAGCTMNVDSLKEAEKLIAEACKGAFNG
ncbi:MAG: bifunctional oligoribonuclease/PAP phosphatase NrnA [Oscillospiraceae bacterium]|nr:bifunctional oligoribonuclease/PAP phosphatase NrnA [Oscillospiraceae bacterium]